MSNHGDSKEATRGCDWLSRVFKLTVRMSIFDISYIPSECIHSCSRCIGSTCASLPSPRDYGPKYNNQNFVHVPRHSLSKLLTCLIQYAEPTKVVRMTGMVRCVFALLFLCPTSTNPTRMSVVQVVTTVHEMT